MAIIKLFRFLREGKSYLVPDEAALDQLAPEEVAHHSSFHRRIVVVSSLFGSVGVGLGVGIDVLAQQEGTEGKEGAFVYMAIVFPLALAAAGLLFGVAATCAFAPRDFLAGPVGRKWMRLIGTKSIAAARLVCLAVVLGVSLIATVAAWAFVNRP
jgi:hypothetical protein